MKKSIIGFTLIELLVVVVVIGILAAIVLITVRGIREEARDAVRMADLRQLQTKLETYWIISGGGYPFSTEDFQIQGHPWGSFWEGYGTVPKDPLPTQSYAYVSDGLSYQLYAKFEKEPINSAFVCANPCGPNGEYNGGIASLGATLVAFEVTPSPEEVISPPEDGKAIACDPAIASGAQTYTVTTKDNPRTTQVVIDPLDVQKNATQTASVKIQETNGKPIAQVTGEAITDSKSFDFSLSLIDGTDTNGTWQGSWLNQDTYCQNYMLIITATSESGQSNVDLAFR